MIHLRNKRMQANLSQQELSALSGIPQQTISTIESGTRKNIGVETLYPIARALGCTIDDLLTPGGEREPQEAV